MLLTGLGAVLAVTALCVGVGVYVSDSDTATATAGAHAASLPDGWRPWQTKLRYDVKGVPLDYDSPGCVAEGSALFCGGTGFTAARIDAASGRALWPTAPALRGRSRSAFATGWSTCTRNRTTGQAHGGSRRRYRAPAVATRHQPVRGGGPVRRRAADPVSRLRVVRGLRAFRQGTVAGALAGGVLHSVGAGRRPLRPVLEGQRARPGPGRADEARTRRPDRNGRRLPKKAEALGAVGGQPLFLAPQTAKDVYEAGYERPYNALLRVAAETGQVDGYRWHIR